MQVGTVTVFRRDKTNVGDWWSPPERYFPLNVLKSIDLIDSAIIPNLNTNYIVGGGGLGNESFLPHLNRLTRSDRRYKLIAWGIGADHQVDRNALIERPDNFDALLDYFSSFDEVGTRIFIPTGFGERTNYHWVPCASCMSPLFRQLSDIKPTQRIGFFSHKRVPLSDRGRRTSKIRNMRSLLVDRKTHFNNSGSDFKRKLSALAQCEFVVTNSYHGVYWATLLGRKVICQPFKDGLYTFKHSPVYLLEDKLEEAMEKAKNYPEALEDCRFANVKYYNYLTEKYGLI